MDRKNHRGEQTCIEMLKALHPKIDSKNGRKIGRTKEEIEEIMSKRFGCYDVRTVQRNLRKLDKNLYGNGELKQENEYVPFYLGGRPVNAEITVEEEGKKRYFYTENTINPIILQANVSQVFLLLEGLRVLSKNRNAGQCVDIGVDIWSQLSGWTKERLKKLFAEDEKSKEFLEDLECLADPENSSIFIPEEDSEDAEGRILHASKVSKRVSIKVEMGGNAKWYRGIMVKNYKPESGSFSIDYGGEIITFTKKMEETNNNEADRHFVISVQGEEIEGYLLEVTYKI